MKKSTLLSINNYYYLRGGAEFVFLEQNRLMEESGFDVVPFAMKHSKNMTTPWSEYFVEEIEFGEDYSFIEKLTRLPKVIYSMEAQKKISALISKTFPDICHAHNIYHHISPSIFSTLKKNGIPTVLTLHDLKLACPSYSMLTHDGICERCKGGNIFNVVKQKCIKGSTALSTIAYIETTLNRYLGSYIDNIDYFIVPSKFYLEKFVEWGFNREQFIHVPNFVDIDIYKPDYTVGKRFLYFGRLGVEKGLPTIIKAASKANIPLTFVGTGPDQNELKTLANKLNVDVEFLGFQSGENLHSAIRAAKCVVIASEWYENAPISILEAYALGKPVIGARIGGVPELIKEETGLTFKSGSADDLAKTMIELINRSESQIEDMGKAGRTWVEQDFSSNKYRERLLNIYKSLGVNLPSK